MFVAALEAMSAVASIPIEAACARRSLRLDRRRALATCDRHRGLCIAGAAGSRRFSTEGERNVSKSTAFAETTAARFIEESAWWF